MLIIFLSAYSALAESKEYDVMDGTNDNEGTKMALMKILTSYSQIISIIGAVPAEWPKIVKPTLELEEVTNFISSMNLDCLFGSFRGDMKQFYFRTILLNTLPFVFMLFSIIFWLIYYAIKKDKFSDGQLKAGIIATVIIIAYN